MDGEKKEHVPSNRRRKDRNLLWLKWHFVDGMTQVEIAEKEGVTSQAVSNVINREKRNETLEYLIATRKAPVDKSVAETIESAIL